jgi:hypothetical protein
MKIESSFIIQEKGIKSPGITAPAARF